VAARFFWTFLLLLAGLIASHAESWPIKKGDVFYSARPALLRKGWKPIEVYSRNEFDLIGEGIRFYRHGFKEVENCSQGRGYCSFHYRMGDRCLMVVTEGEYMPPKSPKIDKWWTYPVPEKNQKSRILSACSDEASVKARDLNTAREY